MTLLKRPLPVQTPREKYLTLSLLLARNNLEVSRIQGTGLFLWLGALLSDLGPSTSTGSFVLGRARIVALIDDALISELAATKELFSEVARVECATCAVD